MKLTTVIGSVNNNPRYYMFVQKQIIFWKHWGINFLCVFVGDKIPDELLNCSANIILWRKNLDLNTAYIAQNIRMYYAALINLGENEMIMITDMDMLPTSPNYYKAGLDIFEKQDFIYYRHLYEDEIFMCYNAAHPDIWGECFGISSAKDIEKELYDNYQDIYTGVPGSEGWSIDQQIMYRSLIQYPHLKILNRPIRRLEVWMYQDHLERKETNFLKYYDDVHFHRNYFANEALILNAEEQLNKGA